MQGLVLTDPRAPSAPPTGISIPDKLIPLFKHNSIQRAYLGTLITQLAFLTVPHQGTLTYGVHGPSPALPPAMTMGRAHSPHGKILDSTRIPCIYVSFHVAADNHC